MIRRCTRYCPGSSRGTAMTSAAAAITMLRCSVLDAAYETGLGSWGCLRNSRTLGQETLRLAEHRGDEEYEREHVAPLQLEEEAAHRDELCEDERSEEA